jgi:hypothetical protein
MSGPERAIGEAAGKPIGEDLRAVEIKHWQIKDHPDHLPEGIDYYSLYQLTTPERVFSSRPRTGSRACRATPSSLIFPFKSASCGAASSYAMVRGLPSRRRRLL